MNIPSDTALQQILQALILDDVFQNKMRNEFVDGVHQHTFSLIPAWA